MRAILLVPVLFIVVVACGSKLDQSEITVYNSTNTVIDSVRITTDGVILKFVQLEPTRKETKSFELKKITGHGDSAFGISLFVKDSIVKSGTFGYYTHSGIKPQYSITIYDDFKFRESSQIPTEN